MAKGTITTVRDLLAKVEKINSEVAELEFALGQLRGCSREDRKDGKWTKDWENNISQDTRGPVQLLWKELQTKRIARANLENSKIRVLSQDEIEEYYKDVDEFYDDTEPMPEDQVIKNLAEESKRCPF